MTSSGGVKGGREMEKVHYSPNKNAGLRVSNLEVGGGGGWLLIFESQKHSHGKKRTHIATHAS